MQPVIVGPEVESLLDWRELLNAFRAGHRLPRAEIADSFLYRDPDTLLSRAAWIDGLGSAVKTATIFPRNPAAARPMINGAVTLFSDSDGTLEAIVDFHIVTRWKTAGDSLHAASLLARPDSRRITVVGAGTVGASMIDAYGALFPDAEFTIWNRSPGPARDLAARSPRARAEADLQMALRSADIICTATMAREPVIRGEWLEPGQHLDLIGAYRPDMREVDDTALRRAALFVDSRETTLDHIGELKIPLAQGVITRDDIRADFYDVAAGRFVRDSAEQITIAKNGGGAHLDLMTARYVLETARRAGNG